MESAGDAWLARGRHAAEAPLLCGLVSRTLTHKHELLIDIQFAASGYHSLVSNMDRKLRAKKRNNKPQLFMIISRLAYVRSTVDPSEIALAD